LALAQLYLGQRNDADAGRLIRDLLDTAPPQAGVLNSVGLLYLQSGSLEGAIAKFRAAIALEPLNATYWANLSNSQLALNHVQDSTDAATKALVINPGSVPAIRALTLIDLRTNRSDAALARVLAAEAEHFEDAAIWELEGDVRVSLKQYPQATRAFDRASDLGAPSAVAVKSFRARREGELPKVGAPLERWVAQQPGDATMGRMLAEFYRSTGRNADAVREYEAIASRGTPDVAVLNNLAWLYQRTGDARAVGTARRAYEMSPTMPAVADTYGWALVQAGQVRAGLELLNSAAKNAEADGDIRFHYAAALARNGDRERAREALIALLAGNTLSDRWEAEQLLRQL
jgi:tetratricopeptide (TPR) repeat protein